MVLTPGEFYPVDPRVLDHPELVQEIERIKNLPLCPYREETA
jgi:hypothetical protein